MGRGSHVVLLAALLVACGAPIVRVTPLQARGSYELALEAAHARGYQVALAQPNRGRIGLLALYSDEASFEHGTYRIAITCNPRSCDIRPIGPRVEWYEQRYHMPEAFRDELVALRRHITSLATRNLRR